MRVAEGLVHDQPSPSLNDVVGCALRVAAGWPASMTAAPTTATTIALVPATAKASCAASLGAAWYVLDGKSFVYDVKSGRRLRELAHPGVTLRGYIDSPVAGVLAASTSDRDEAERTVPSSTTRRPGSASAKLQPNRSPSCGSFLRMEEGSLRFPKTLVSGSGTVERERNCLGFLTVGMPAYWRNRAEASFRGTSAAKSAFGSPFHGPTGVSALSWPSRARQISGADDRIRTGDLLGLIGEEA